VADLKRSAKMKTLASILACLVCAVLLAAQDSAKVTVTVRIIGAVKNPGIYELRKDAVLRAEIIAATGGFSSGAHEEKAAISRKTASGESKGFPVDLKGRGSELVGAVLQDGDRLWVPEFVE
jgi:protein involved in polysaccharide export with SLBB domain